MLAGGLLALAIGALGVRWSGEFHPAPAPKGGFWTARGGWVVFAHEFPQRGVALRARRSRDGGRTWESLGVVASDPERETDLGDGNAVETSDGRWLAVFRRNRYRGPGPKHYAIEVSQSLDGGQTWARHSVVTSHSVPGDGPSRGLWAPLLFVAPSGELQCYYDDENLPHELGFPGHQWVVMRRWIGGRWSSPVVVAREPRGLSRDGMPAVVTVGSRLLCLFEGVQPDPPHVAVIRASESADGGRTWSPPRLVFQARPEGFHAVAPTAVSRGDRVLLVFCTNQGRESSRPSGSPPRDLRLDVVWMESVDGGRTWSIARTVYAGSHQNYLPSLTMAADGTVLLSFLDYGRGALATEGRLP
ncbi:MAG: glycoside hydrolase [Fimbriimonadales bacterium]|nr:glycoside hydrolase [Fimbriimonadales bacterium]